MSDENRQMDHKVVFEPYDMDTALGTNNSGVLMFSPYLEDTDTVSSVIAGGDSGGSEAPVYNAQDSVLWNNLRDAFRSELVQMYRNLRASNGPWQYNAIEKRFEDHQAIWPEAIFNEDAWVKYIIPLVDPVTVDDDTGELIRTDRYLTMLQGSKKEQRKWWLYNRLRYLDSKYDTGNASSNIINIRFFNGGTLKLKTAIPMYAAVSFGGGTTPEIKRTEANTEVSFTYVPGTGVTEMETWIHSGNLITDVGDLSVFYPNECDFSKASLLKRLKIGDSTSGYSNANLTTINVRNSPLLEYIDCRNCPRLGITVNLENSPRLVEAYFDGTSITGLDLADGCAIETLHLPASVTALTLLNLTKLNEFVIPSYANIARFMFDSIDTTVVNPVSVLSAIRPNSQVNIQGLYLELADVEAISDFFDLVDTMTGVTREKSTTTGEWIYHNEEQAVIAGEVHTYELTGDEIAELNTRYPYVRITADHTTTTLKYYNYDGSQLLYTETIYDGGNGTYDGTPTREQDAQYTYAFAGWSIYKNATSPSVDAINNVTTNRSVYAAYSTTIRTYRVRFMNDTEVLQTYEDVPYGSTVRYTGATPMHPEDIENYVFTRFVPSGENITGTTDCMAMWLFTGVITRRILEKTISEYVSSGVSYVGESAFEECHNLMHVSFENVTFTSERAFSACGTMTSVDLPNLTVAGKYAFYSCVNLYSNPFSKLEIISNYAFYSCYGMQAFSGPSVKEIGYSAFAYCSALKSVNFDSVELVASNAFCSCVNLDEVSFNSNIVRFEKGMFSNCYALKSFSHSGVTELGPTVFYSCYALKNVSFPNVETIESSAFAFCYNLETAYFSKLKALGYNAFANCYNLKAVVLGSSSVCNYGNSPLANASFVNIYVPESLVESYKTAAGWSYISSRIFSIGAIPSSFERSIITDTSVETIGTSAYSGQRGVKEFDFPNATVVGSNAFAGCCGMESISLPNVLQISSYAFNGCNAIEMISLPEVTIIGQGAFWSCYNLSSIYAPKLQSIHGAAFQSCRFEEISFPSLIAMSSSAFIGCGCLASVTLENIRYIPSLAFAYCGNLKYVSIPQVSSLQSSCFRNCYTLPSISLPNTYYIGSNAFENCYNLSTVYLGEARSINGDAFNWCFALRSLIIATSSVCTLYSLDAFKSVSYFKVFVPASLVSLYKKAYVWSDISSKIFSIPEV